MHHATGIVPALAEHTIRRLAAHQLIVWWNRRAENGLGSSNLFHRWVAPVIHCEGTVSRNEDRPPDSIVSAVSTCSLLARVDRSDAASLEHVYEGRNGRASKDSE